MSHSEASTSERGQRGGEAARVRQGGGERALVEPDLGVGEVVVVDEQQVGLLAADELGHRGARAVDVELEAVGAVQRAVAHGVQRRSRGVCGRSVSKPGAQVCSMTAEAMRPRSSTSTTGRSVLTPAVSSHGCDQVRRSRPEVASSSREQVVEGGVAPGVLGEVGAQAVAERLAPDVGDELLEHRGALGVGDAVEVDLDVLEVADLGDDRVGRA